MTLQEKQKAYWNAHFETLRLLAIAGIQWPAKERLPIFKIHQRVLKLDHEQVVKDKLSEYLSALVKMRAAGGEPEYTKSGTYK